MLDVIKELCPQDHPCPLVNACPVGAISQLGWSAPTIDQNKCIECGICTNSCPHHALVNDLKDEGSLRYSA